MLPKERLAIAMSGGKPDRVPVFPKISHALASLYFGKDFTEFIEDPSVSLRLIADTAMAVGYDGARQFHLPARKTQRKGEALFEVNDKGELIGEIEVLGSFATRLRNKDFLKLDDPYHIAYLQWWTSEFPLVETMAHADSIAVPDKAYYEKLGCGDRQREVMEQVGDRLALAGDLGSPTLGFASHLRGTQTLMYDLTDNPELIHALHEKGTAISIEKGKFSLDLGIRFLRLNDSVANMSVISPAHFREFVKPYFKRVCNALHAYCPEVRIYSHICGNILPVLKDLAETGLDCIGCLDPLGGFTCAQAREAVGDKVALIGGVNTLSFLNATPRQLFEEAKRCIEEAGKNGAYVLGSGCGIPRMAKKENLLALAEAAR